MRLKINNTDEKLFGVYYTPFELANKLIEILSNDLKFDKILEPSCGEGVFIDALKYNNKINNSRKIDVVEIDSEAIEVVRDKYGSYKNINIYNKDFFKFIEKNKELYDLIIGNPPYIRYQYLTEEQREIQSKILTSSGMKSNKLINAWVAFLVGSVKMLKEGGDIAFIIPVELLQVAYAKDLRKFLSNNLAQITILTFNDLLFEEAQQEVIVFIGRKKVNNNETKIRIIEFKDLNEFLNTSNHKILGKKYQLLKNTSEKWTKYFLTKEESNLIEDIKNDKRFMKMSEVGIINVGITTGNNNFFSVDKTTVLKYDLEGVTLPLIGRSSHAKGIYFNEKDWHDNLKEDKKANLLVFPNKDKSTFTKLQRKYIMKGENNGENLGYKCSIREFWYSVPSVWIPEVFYLRRNHLYPKMVLNKCNAVSTDTMHRIKLDDDIDRDNLLLSYYNSISFAFTEICGRSYGGGVLEILPGELGNIRIPNINNIEIKNKKEILDKIDDIVRTGKDIEEALDLVDKSILVDILGIPGDCCISCREIWKKLQERRLTRK